MPRTATQKQLAPSRFLHNEALRAEVVDRLRSNWPKDSKDWPDLTFRFTSTDPVLKNLPRAVVIQPGGTPPSPNFSPASIEKPNVHLESIILPLARPVVFVQDNDFGPAPLQYWQDRLNPARNLIKAGIPAVGRIELRNHDLYAWNGTAWLVRPDVAVTNAHVARVFASSQNGRWVFRTNSIGRNIQSKVNFREEYQRPNVIEELDVVEILYLEENSGPDIALLRVRPDPARGSGIRLATTVAPNTEIATIGYPKYDSSIPDPEMLVSIFNGIYDVKRLSPGLVTEVTPSLLKHDCSTLGGNSGSTMISLATGEAVGLHFGGNYKISNFAVPAPMVAALLSKLQL